jgi:hypothetical protein
LKQPGEDVRTPQGQLDSNQVAFAVIPRPWQTRKEPGPQLGDFGVAWRRSNDKAAFFVIGDIGPRNKLGEGSVALHRALGNDPFQLRSGVRRALKGIAKHDVVYLLFPKTAQPGQKLDTDAIDRLAGEHLQTFGGMERLKDCASTWAR